MAGIDLGTIQQDLARRFAAPLPEFYKRRIIFWYDEDREFEDQLEDLSLDGVEVIVLTGNNTFTVKKQLCEDNLTTNFLVYDPRPFMKDDDNWLINVQIYSEEFRADLNSIWMDEMGLPATPIIRNQVKHYRKFFRAKDRRDTVKKLSGSISTAPQMHLAVMAALAGCNDIQPNKIIKAVIHAGLDLDTNSIYQSFLTYGADKPFWVMVSQATGYSEGDDSNLGRLAIHMLLTAATRTMHQDHLAGLDAFISTPYQAYCYKMYQRNKDKIDTKPVTISLLSANRKISNMIFSLNFYQKEAVGGNREAATYLLYFVDVNGQKISDTSKIIADKASDNAQERTFRCNFNLRSQKYSNRETYYLIIADESGLQAPIREEFQIDIAFAVDEFNFF